VILDTNIVSYLMRGGPVADRYAPHIQERLLYITFVTIGEMYYGAERGAWGQRRRSALAAYLGRFTVVPYNLQVSRRYGMIRASRESRGVRIETNDAWIAACAVEYRLPLVTHNARDFQNIHGLQVVTEQMP